jgi:hypothetical protein
MGQSNAGCHFANALSDVKCSLGTAYWWGANGTSSASPADFTNGTTGFRAPLIAELRAQSVAAGNPVKNVLVWENGITSTSGQSITGWASTSAVTQDTEDTATMIKKCKKYYTDRSDLYEIVSLGMYWLQGEIDGSTDTANHEPMDPETYEACFMRMWRKLKQTGLEYVAFLRVRGDVADNQHPNADAPDHNDIDSTTALSAQLKMIAENDNFYLATSLTEQWVGTKDTEHTIDISNYYTLMDYYSGGTRFEDEYGNGYMMILNRDYMKNAEIELSLNGNYRLYEVSKTDGLQHVACENTDKLALELAPGDAVLYRLQPADEEAYTIEYRLSK